MPQQILDKNELEFDEELVLIQAQKNAADFKPIYEKYFRKVFLFVHHRIGEKELSADITHQVFLKALTNLSNYQFRGLPISAWLFHIDLNECNDYYRKTKKVRLISISEKTTQHLHEEITYDLRIDELENRLPSLLQKLSEEELQFIQLRFFEGRSFKEVADILEMTEGNAKVKTYRIIEKIKKMFLRK